MTEDNQARWYGVRPTTSNEAFSVQQSDPDNLKARVSQASIVRTIQEPLSVDDNGGSLTVDAQDSAPLQSRGKIPSGATQVSEYNDCAGSIVIIHTVTSGKTFYVNMMSFNAYNGSGGVGTAWFCYRDASDANPRFPIRFRFPDGVSMTEAIALPVPLELPEGYDVYITSSAMTIWGYGYVHGYEL